MEYKKALEIKNNYVGLKVDFTMCGEKVSGTIIKTDVKYFAGKYEIECLIQEDKGKTSLTLTELNELRAFEKTEKTRFNLKFADGSSIVIKELTIVEAYERAKLISNYKLIDILND